MLDFFHKNVKEADYFGKPVLITFDKQKKFKTFIGGFLSFIIFGLIFSLIVTNGLNLINRKQPKTSSTTLYQSESPLLNIKKTRSVFAAYFMTRSFAPFFDPTYFNFEISQFKVERKANGDSAISYTPLEIKNCSIYMEDFKQKNFEKEYIQNSLSQAVCFDTSQGELILGGKFSGNYFSNILFSFNRCRNKTSNPQIKKKKRSLNLESYEKEYNNLDNRSINEQQITNTSVPNMPNRQGYVAYNDKVSKNASYLLNKQNQLNTNNIYKKRNLEEVSGNNNNNITAEKHQSSIKSKSYYEENNIICKSNEEINSMLQSGYFELFYIDQNIDLSNFGSPFQDFFSLYFILLDPGSRKFVDLYFKTVNITSDPGFIFESLKVDTGLVFDYYREQMETSVNSEKIIEVYINSSNNVLKYSVIYLKFQDFAAGIGGFMNTLLLIGSFLTMIFNDHKMHEKIINKLFDVSLEEELKFTQSRRKSKILNLTFNDLENNIKMNKNEIAKENFYNNYLISYNDANYPNTNNNNNNNTALRIIQDNNNNNDPSDAIKSTSKKLANASKNKRPLYSTNSLGHKGNFNNYNYNNIPFQSENEANEASKIRNSIHKNIEVDLFDFKNIKMNYLASRNQHNNFSNNQERIEKTDFINHFEIEKNTLVVDNTKAIEQGPGIENKGKMLLKRDSLFSSEKAKMKYLMSIEKLNKINKKFIFFNFFEIIAYYIFPCSCGKNIKNKGKIFDMSKSKLFKYMDFLEIVNHLQEFSKLKKIIFSRDQLELFRIHQRPLITNKKFQDSNSVSYKVKNDDYYFDLLISYKNALKNSENNPILKSLINNIDNGLKRVFEEAL